MKEIGQFLLIYGCVLFLSSLFSHGMRLAKWNVYRTAKDGKRQAATEEGSDWLTWLGEFLRPFLSASVQTKLSKLIIWSGLDTKGKIGQFLGACIVFLAGALVILGGSIAACITYETWWPFGLGLPIVFLIAAAPAIGILVSRKKRADSILRDTPALVMTVRRELIRDDNYLEAFVRAEAEVSGILKEELALLNEYVRSTRGDIRTALAHFRERCSHRAVNLFCMTVVQGMDTDRVVAGLAELEQQMTDILKDRVQKQTEKRNFMVFMGAMTAVSILMLQGAFYGLIKLKEQMVSLPF